MDFGGLLLLSRCLVRKAGVLIATRYPSFVDPQERAPIDEKHRPQNEAPLKRESNLRGEIELGGENRLRTTLEVHVAKNQA